MVGGGEPLKETRDERRFYDDLGAESNRNEAWRPMSEVVSLAVLWLDSRTYQGKLERFHLQRMQSVQIFASRTGWLDTSKIYMKLQPGEFYAAGMDKLPKIPFDREQGIIDLANRTTVA